MMEEIKKQYNNFKSDIDNKIQEIKNDVLSCNPIKLLKYSFDMSKMYGIKFYDNVDYIQEAEKKNQSPYIATEFIQSIYVSSPVNDEIDLEQDKSEVYSKIIADIEELVNIIHRFYVCWGIKLKSSDLELDEDILMLLIEEQSLFLVRGNRYQVFELEYHKKLLDAHNDIFVDLFGLTSQNIIDGMKKLQYAMSQQILDTYTQLSQIIDKFDLNINNHSDVENYIIKNKEEFSDIFGKIMGTSLFDVQQITGWTNRFIDELSWEQNSCPEFWDGEFGGWPIIDTPISKKPFIKIDGTSYCFDYYLVFDNIYRAIQKATTRVDNKYQWSKVQQCASEKMVADVFRELLPGCTIYSSNYYPKNQSLKQMAENDLIVVYDDTLIITEVKAGSFVYTSPITDFDAHIKSYKKLIEEADLQCQRTKEYLEKSNKAVLYNKDKTEKAQIDLTQISSMYMISVTIDNINSFAAKAEKLKFLKLKSKAISIAIDDLMVYRDYFNSPLIFLHFLKQRYLATQNPKIALNDELDHLGLYISNNYYTFLTKDIKEDTHILFGGFRDELDKYFESLYHHNLKIPKPVQKIPNLFLQIIDYLTVNNIANRSAICNYFLDFSTESRNVFCDKVLYVLKRQKEIRTVIPFVASGRDDSLRYTVFVNQLPYAKDIVYQKEYALASLNWNGENDRTLIVLYYENDKFQKLEFKVLTPNDINDENKDRISKLGQLNAERRLDNYRIRISKKIGRNDLCPCGSGKKYKKCCGR